MVSTILFQQGLKRGIIHISTSKIILSNVNNNINVNNTTKEVITSILLNITIL